MLETKKLVVATPSSVAVVVDTRRGMLHSSDKAGIVTQAACASESIFPSDVLVVDDDRAVRKACCEMVALSGLPAKEAASLAEARALLSRQKFDLLLLDLKLPDGNGLGLLRHIKALHPQTGVVVMTAFATISSAVEAMQIGAGDYLTKPFGRAELITVLERASQRRQLEEQNRHLREGLRTQKRLGGLVGDSEEMQRLYRILAKVAYSTHPVLILGEDGTEKELVGRSIHANGPNVAKSFAYVDCGSQSQELLEEKLFGSARDDSTRAGCTSGGLLSMAKGGTVYLDEIGELSADLQMKLLRALQLKEVRAVGSPQAQPLSARVLAATSQDLSVLVGQGRFRKDLYVRLNVVNLKVPPLRDRQGDVTKLAMHFLERIGKEAGIKRSLSDDVLRMIMEYDWPGNVWELEWAIEGACALSAAPMLHPGDFPTKLTDFWLRRQGGASSESNRGHRTSESAVPDRETRREEIVSIAEMEKHAIQETIRRLGGDKQKAAALLGIGKTTLYRKLKEYEIAST